jgi:restriction system protein
MAIPDYQTFMFPLLKFAADKQEHSLSETIDFLCSEFNITEEERNLLLPSGTQFVVDNRISWAKTYLSKAGLLESTRRGYFKISKKGLDFLQNNPSELNVKILMQFEDFKNFIKSTRNNKEEHEEQYEDKASAYYTPQEALEYGIAKINETLADDLLQRIKQCDPSFFEKLVIDLLVKMGYGGSKQEAAQVVGKAGDEGIDGIIKEDKLGLDIIYVQAKRWENVIGRPEIQKFMGALAGQKANKGIFITTSSFTKEAEDYAKGLSTKLILIDGKGLTDLMIEYNVGVSTVDTIAIKKIDSDYFNIE